MNGREFLIASAALAAGAAAKSGAETWTRLHPEYDKAKLARIGILSLDFNRILKSPDHPDDPARTLDFMDFPDMCAERYGVHWVEPFSTHFLSTEPAYLKEFLGRVKRAHSGINQISVGGLSLTISEPTLTKRLEAIDLTKEWIDHCALLECPRIQVNQGSLAPEIREEATQALKTITDYGKSKKPIVHVTLETRGGNIPWQVLADVIKQAGAWANPDCGNFPNEEARHAGLRVFYPMSSGSSHVHYDPDQWSLRDAIAISKEVGYKGIFAIESSPRNGADPYDAVQEILDALIKLI